MTDVIAQLAASTTADTLGYNYSGGVSPGTIVIHTPAQIEAEVLVELLHEKDIKAKVREN